MESRKLMAVHPVAINFNDEALWDANLATSINQSKQLGVTSVRLWVGVPDWDKRPNPWDPVPPFGSVTAGETPPDDPHVNSPATVLKRAFELKREGFSVMLIVNGNEGAQPGTAAQVQGYFRHLLKATETPTSTETLADVVDYWEIGNEPELSWYWAPSGVDKTAGLKSYVNDFLIPAADVLHSGGYNETVVSAGLAGSPANLKIVIDEIKAKGRADAVDYVGFHPYGNYSGGGSVNEPLDRSKLAYSYASGIGKKMMATEWNVRGFGNTGANDAAWAAAMDVVYKTAILPYYDANYYFALVNNWAARGGTTSARPGGVLKHTSPISVTPGSSIPDLKTYYESPLVIADPFYSKYKSWQYGSLSGVVANASPGSTAAVPATTVYVDVNNNGSPDAGEPSTLTGNGGAFTLQYGSRQVTPGQYFLRVVTPTGWLPAANALSVSLANLKTQSGIALSLTPQAPVTVFGNVSGTVWKDDDSDRIRDTGEAAAAGYYVYLDMDNDSVRDAGEPSAISAADGSYALQFDPSKFTAVAASLRVDAGVGGVMTTPAPLITIAAGTRAGVALGIKPAGSTPSTTGSISGVLWNDSDGDGVIDSNESVTGARTVYIDANRNGKQDAGEKSVSSNSAGVYKFTGLTAGTYNISRVFPAGYRLSNAATSYLPVVLAAGQNITTANIGTTNKPATGGGGTGGGGTGGGGTGGGGTGGGTGGTGTASIKGTFFAAKTSYQAELLSKNFKIYLDANKNGKLDTGEVSTTPKSDWTYLFSGLTAKSYRVAVVGQTGWNITTPASKIYDITLTAGKAVTGKNFIVAKA